MTPAPSLRSTSGRNRRPPGSRPPRGAAALAVRPLRRWSVAELIARAAATPATHRPLAH
jgi:hypothetical protein